MINAEPHKTLPAEEAQAETQATERPRRQRRKAARPGEVLEAATAVLIEKGFAATTLDEVARRAGIAKGTVYRYYATKEELFEAVAKQATERQLHLLERLLDPQWSSIAATLSDLLAECANVLNTGQEPAIASLVIAEARRFPELAQIWHDSVSSRVLDALAAWIAAAQGRGEVRAGDPRLLAYSLSGPILVAVLFDSIFGPIGVNGPDLDALARQHAELMLRGILIDTS
jgi:AcrR family transcriptional regulator